MPKSSTPGDLLPPTIVCSMPSGTTSAASTSPAQASPEAQSTNGGEDALLALLADAVDDLERTRIATANRVRSLVDEKGMGGTPEHRRMEAMVKALKDIEMQAEKDLRRAMRHHPFGPWCKTKVGVGEKQLGRLLAAIGDPYIKPAVLDEDGEQIEPARPRRGPAELWQLCGHGDPARSRLRKGERCAYSPIAKMRVHLVAESCLIQDGVPDKNGKPRPLSPYRAVYDRERAKWAGRETSEGHKHNHALRVAGKEILKDLWIEARRLHEMAV